MTERVGTGLGLNIARQIIVEAHAGRLTVLEGEGPTERRGACLRVELPVLRERMNPSTL